MGAGQESVCVCGFAQVCVSKLGIVSSFIVSVGWCWRNCKPLHDAGPRQQNPYMGYALTLWLDNQLSRVVDLLSVYLLLLITHVNI